MKTIFKELIKEANIGNVIIDDESWPIAFNTKILEENKIYENENNFSVALYFCVSLHLENKFLMK